MKINLLQKRLLLLLIISVSTNVYAQNLPTLEYLCTMNVKLGMPLVPGDGPHGFRRIIPIAGGTVTGEKLQGEVLAGGADWQVIRKDGAAEISAEYQIKTSDGVIIYLKNIGLRVASTEVAARLGKGEFVDPKEYYFRMVTVFEAPTGKYDWLNKSVFIAIGTKNPQDVEIKIYKVL
ncbi:MAG: DUF3237 domain-containing protein [Bacteroidetes bacterium]|nr:DUF3237 domain-containing protein [Bacteroidota bacterium]